MSGKRIFVLNGHPAETSLSRQLAETYAASAEKAGHDVRVMHIRDMSFDMDHGFGGYGDSKPLEPVLEEVLSNLEWSEHMVLATPMWWGNVPAKLKGLFDRALLPGRTFDTKGKGLPKPMLTGRTARVLLTSDTPGWFFRLIYGNALIISLRKQVLGFIGLKAKFTHFSGASHPKDGAVSNWLNQANVLGGTAQ